jgi:hypothetical protein
MIDLAFAAALAGIGAFLLWLFWVLLYRPAAKRKERQSPRFRKDNEGTVREKGMGARSCPVCGEKLAPGMLVKSKLYSQKGVDRIMHVYGCPYCWPYNTEYRRICPVCEKIVPKEGYLIARYFENPQRRHVHVLGCSGCRMG